MNVETLSDLFVVELNRIYTVEQRLVDELAALERDANVDALDDHGHVELREQLTETLSKHRSETEAQVDRLEDAFAAMDRQPESRSTPALDGLFEEKELFNNVVLNDELRPIYYIGTAQSIEQLELAAYDRLSRLAAVLEVPDEVREALEQNREEEANAMERLQELAEDDAVTDLLSELAESLPST